jgi:hypothetical protein
LGNTLLIFKNTNLVGVWISLEVSVIFKRDKFSGYVGVIWIRIVEAKARGLPRRLQLLVR